MEGAMSHPWVVVIAVLAVAALYVLLPLVADTFRRYRNSRLLRCPETGGKAEVGIDASRAAITSAFGRARLRVKTCSLWPEKEQCRQDCLSLPEVERPEALQLQAR
jgi:hypothetical protein